MPTCNQKPPVAVWQKSHLVTNNNRLGRKKMTNTISSTQATISFLRDFLELHFSGNLPTFEDTKRVFTSMLDGDYSHAQIAAVLTTLRIKGEDAQMMSAGAAAMREAATAIQLAPDQRPLADNCGTGGDGSNSFNISTASAIVAAAAGALVAKHGNRSVSSKCGSADLLFAAGLPDTLTPTQVSKLLKKTGFTFFFAPHFHPGMKHVMPVRQSLGVRTIFNLLGPLANPIRPETQIIGVGDRRYISPMVEAAKKLGLTRALVVHSRDGLDEISPADITDAAFFDGEKIIKLEIDPKKFGIKGTLKELKGGDSTENLEILQQLLDGRSALKNAESIFDAVSLNAGALLWLCDKSIELSDGVKLAQETISSGVAKRYFSNWIAVAKQIAIEGE